MIAEDDPVSLRVLQAFLSKWKYQVVMATDGWRRCGFWIERAPLAILDWMMPGMDGEVIVRAKSRPAQEIGLSLHWLRAVSRQNVIFLHVFGEDDYLTSLAYMAQFPRPSMPGIIQSGMASTERRRRLENTQPSRPFHHDD